MKLRVFYTIHKLASKGVASIEPKYDKTKTSEDFPEETSPDEAYRSIYNRFGKVTDGGSLNGYFSTAPDQYARISNHTFVDETRQPVVLEDCFRATDQDLLSPMMLKAALVDSPRRRRARR